MWDFSVIKDLLMNPVCGYSSDHDRSGHIRKSAAALYQPGIFIPNSMEMNAVREVAANMGGSLGSSINTVSYTHLSLSVPYK